MPGDGLGGREVRGGVIGAGMGAAMSNQATVRAPGDPSHRCSLQDPKRPIDLVPRRCFVLAAICARDAEQCQRERDGRRDAAVWGTSRRERHRVLATADSARRARLRDPESICLHPDDQSTLAGPLTAQAVHLHRHAPRALRPSIFGPAMGVLEAAGGHGPVRCCNTTARAHQDDARQRGTAALALTVRHVFAWRARAVRCMDSQGPALAPFTAQGLSIAVASTLPPPQMPSGRSQIQPACFRQTATCTSHYIRLAVHHGASNVRAGQRCKVATDGRKGGGHARGASLPRLLLWMRPVLVSADGVVTGAVIQDGGCRRHLLSSQPPTWFQTPSPCLLGALWPRLSACPPPTAGDTLPRAVPSGAFSRTGVLPFT